MNEFEQYTEQLKSPNRKARANAAYKLGVLGDSKAIPWLEDRLDDPDYIVRCRAANALGRFEAPSLIAPLTKALKDPNDEVYGCVASALSRIGNEQAIITLINEANAQGKRRQSIAINNLVKIGQLAVENLIGGFNKSSGRTRAYFLKALGRIADMRASEIFINAILDEDYDVFWVATAIQQDIRDPQAVPALIASLEHESYLRQAGAARTLQIIGDRRALEPLVKVVEDEGRHKLARSAATSALGMIGGADVADILLKAAKENDEDIIQWAALSSLSHTGDPKVVKHLVDRVNRHPDLAYFHSLIKNLTINGSLPTIRELERILQNENLYDSRVLQTIKTSLEELKQRWHG